MEDLLSKFDDEGNYGSLKQPKRNLKPPLQKVLSLPPPFIIDFRFPKSQHKRGLQTVDLKMLAGCYFVSNSTFKIWLIWLNAPHS